MYEVIVVGNKMFNYQVKIFIFAIVKERTVINQPVSN